MPTGATGYDPEDTKFDPTATADDSRWLPPHPKEDRKATRVKEEVKSKKQEKKKSSSSTDDKERIQQQSYPLDHSNDSQSRCTIA